MNTSPVVAIDDEAEVLELLGDILRMEGYDALGLLHPADVALLDARVDPCLFLVDIMLPDISGIELAGSILTERYPRVPRVALSASPDLLVEAEASGLFAAAVSKPFDLATLLDLVQRHASTRGN